MRATAKTKRAKIAPSIEVQEHIRSQENPPEDNDLCHIRSGDGRTAYCGNAVGDQATCGIYNGETVCPECGRATCPTCATMSDLHWELVKDEGDDG